MLNENKKNVTTINGETVPFESCKLIKGKYYKIGHNQLEDSGDCYIIDNKVYLKEDLWYAKIYNLNIFQYFPKNDPRISYGIIDFVNQKFIYGYFKKSLKSSKYVDDKNNINELIDFNLLFSKNGPYYYNYYDNMFYSIVHYNRYTDHNSKVHIDNNIKTQFPYSVTDQYLKDFSKNYNKLKISDFKKNREFELFQKLFKNTYGFEFETSKGLIPNKYLYDNGLMPLRDGSIDGIEYATIPLSGAFGMSLLKNNCEYLNLFTEYDEKCSMHIHIGGLERKIDNILAFLKLIVFSQNDFYKLFPLYKKYHFGYKNKSYSEPYPEYFKILFSEKLDTKEKRLDVFSKIFNYLSQGRHFKTYNNDLNQITNHPADPTGQQKWNIKTRYKIVNVIPLIFGNKKTVEFRIHTPTFDFNKLLVFLYVCDSIVELSNNFTDEILMNNDLFSKNYILETLVSQRTSLLLSTSKSKFENDILYNLNEYISMYFDIRFKNISDYHRQGINFPNENDIFKNVINRNCKLSNLISKISFKNSYENKISFIDKANLYNEFPSDIIKKIADNYSSIDNSITTHDFETIRSVNIAFSDDKISKEPSSDEGF